MIKKRKSVYFADGLYEYYCCVYNCHNIAFLSLNIRKATSCYYLLQQQIGAFFPIKLYL